MAQLSWRLNDELMGRVRQAAASAGRSMNEYVTWVLEAATNPDLAGTEAERVRARLAAAGVLADPGPPQAKPPADAVARAMAAAGTGTALSELVSRDR